ncbi:MAG: RidA family protein [Candidatus Heimdallarchaeota archaeon]|nr:RidA family protein [Candidatus Heimdallarchaeota archaeon]MDH5646933.1 RidA family protein [Candidatus Heimdallarchaeota archaeon]
MRINYSSGSKWEEKFGYSRAVKINGNLYISGTTSFNSSGEIVGIGDPYLQTKQIILNIQNVLDQAGGKLDDIYRVRVFITQADFSDEVLKAFSEHFIDIKPAATLVCISALLIPEMLVEVEVDAFIGD